MTKADLIAFEAEIAELFNSGAIRAPVHLAGGNEDELIEIFKEVRPEDWVLSQWRSHYHALLHGVPPAEVREAILRGRSITLNFPAQRVLTSAIVGGVLPIAVGLAMGLKRKHEEGGSSDAPADRPSPRVWVFVGDMTMRTGAFHEALNYAAGHDLPLRFVIEDNGISVCTPTAEVWGAPRPAPGMVRGYSYKLPWPHAGAGKRVSF